MSAKRLMRLLLKVSGTLLLALILILSIIITAGVVLKNEQGLSPWGTGFYMIASGSMEPTLSVGSLIYVTAVSADSIKANDVLTFQAINGVDIVTHRVREVTVGENGYVYTTRGDANNADDALLPYERVIGRMAFAIPETSVLLVLFRDIKYLGIIVVVIGVVICASGFIGRSGKKKKREVE